MGRSIASVALALTVALGSAAPAAGKPAVQIGKGGDADMASISVVDPQPPAPPSAETRFVVDTGPGLDTPCTYQSGGPLVVTIPVGRVVKNTNPDVSLTAMKTAGLITDATLLLPAWDVDYDGSGSSYNPERDKVYFNDSLVTEQYLTGSNGKWHLNAFTIPIEWVKFPADPGSNNPAGTANNVIRIEIDTANTSDIWCTAIAWASLEFEAARPVVLVHGIFSSGSSWNGPWVSELTTSGLPFSNSLSMGPLDGIDANAGKIASEIESSKARWGVQKVNLVCHSKGGIDARKYVWNHDDVDKLIQIGTPNEGSPLADWVQAGLALPVVPFLVVNAFQLKAGWELTTLNMDWFNREDYRNPNVVYTSLAGDYVPTCLFCWERWSQGIVGPGDGIVSISSAHAIDYADPRTYSPGPGNSQARHDQLNTSLDVYNDLKAKVLSLESAGKATEGSPPVQRLATFGGSLAQHDTVSVGSVDVDEASKAYFTLLYPSGDIDFWVTSPSGRVYNQFTGSDSALYELTSFLGGRLGVYSFRTAEVGTWTVKASAFSSGPIPFLLNGWLESTGISLNASTTPAFLPVGGALGFEARVRNAGAAVTGATVKASVLLPDSTRQEITLLDNGALPDTVANDGNYAGDLVNVPLSGGYRAIVTASRSGVPGQPDFRREAPVFATVSTSSSSFQGSFDDRVRDIDGDGYFDSLAVDVSLNITATGRYRVTGTLEDSAGNLQPAWVEVDLTAGIRNLTLLFDGRTIFQRQVNGPYTLQGLHLSEILGGDIQPLEDFAGSFVTDAYSYSAFERTSFLRHNPLGSDQGIDADGHSLFDLLRVSLGFDVDSTAQYLWSATLADSAGNDICVAAGETQLTAGADTLVIDFPGSPIGAHGVDGPFLVRDLLVYAGNISALLRDAYQTTALPASAFEGGIPADKKLYITGTFAYDDSLLGPDQHVPCTLVVAFDTKDHCVGCDSTALDPLGTARLVYTSTGKFTIGPLFNQDSNDDNGPLDIVVRVYLKNNESCWTEVPSYKWFLTMTDSLGDTWYYDSQLYNDVSGDTLNIGVLKPTDYAHRGALHVYKTLVENAWGRAFSDGILPEPVEVVWNPGYSVSPGQVGTYYVPTTRKLYVDGRQDTTVYAPDEWDDVVFNRAYGHVVAEALGVRANASGPHGPCLAPVADSLAWNEAFASHFAMDVQDFWGLPFTYVNRGRDLSGAMNQYTIDFETGCVSPACPTGCPNNAGSGNELAVAGALWDLFDSINDNQNGDAFGDSVSEGPTRFWATVKSTRPYIRTIQGFRDAYIASYAKLTADPRKNWLVRQAFLEHGIGVTFTDVEETLPSPAPLALYPCRPNPFNPSTRLIFSVPGTAKTKVRLILFNVRGQRVRTLVRGELPPGPHEVIWDGRNERGEEMASGVYLCKLETVLGSRSIKMVIAR